jgi:hypothetical protein
LSNCSSKSSGQDAMAKTKIDFLIAKLEGDAAYVEERKW